MAKTRASASLLLPTIVQVVDPKGEYHWETLKLLQVAEARVPFWRKPVTGLWALGVVVPLYLIQNRAAWSTGAAQILFGAVLAFAMIDSMLLLKRLVQGGFLRDVLLTPSDLKGVLRAVLIYQMLRLLPLVFLTGISAWILTMNTSVRIGVQNFMISSPAILYSLICFGMECALGVVYDPLKVLERALLGLQRLVLNVALYLGVPGVLLGGALLLGSPVPYVLAALPVILLISIVTYLLLQGTVEQTTAALRSREDRLLEAMLEALQRA